MDSGRWDRIQSVFLDALEREAAERDAFLAEACGDDAELRAEVDSMLAAHGGPRALAAEAWVADPAPTRVGTRIGPYRTKELLGRGGMGEVYLAERADDQFQQEVALKLLPPATLDAEAIRRFRVERQILARLTHPHIARLLDGGVDEAGRPYLVMERVRGVSITEHSDRERLDVEARLELFLAVCDAVDYAHRNLVVHRDVKPSNVLVGEDGQVKLLDFGIAKLLEPELLGFDTSLTHTGARPMTTECAAPEQVRGETVTTATDVYALGVLLYELLTGQPPYRLPRHRPHEAERIICGEEPSRPSAVVTRSAPFDTDPGDRATTPDDVGRARGLAPRRLRHLLRGDLDNIVMMALRKEPERRYPSARALADDLRRFRTGQPVVARTDAVGYRTRKFVQRNRGAVAAGTTIALLLVGSSVLTAVQSREVRQERDRARLEAAKAAHVTDFLLGLFDAAVPSTVPRDTMRVRELLERGRDEIESLGSQPEVQIEATQMLSHAYWRLGRNDVAQELAERGVAMRRRHYGDDDPRTADGLYWLGTLRQSQMRYDEARSMLEEALEIQRKALGPDHYESLKSQFRLGMVLHGTQDRARADALLADWQAALRSQRGGEDQDLGILLSSLGYYLLYAGRAEEAEVALRRSLEIRTRVHGPDDYRVAGDKNALSGVYVNLGRAAEAETLAREALTSHRTLFPEGHFALAVSLDNLGDALSMQGRFEEAEKYLHEAFDVYRSLYGQEHGFVAHAYLMLGMLYQRWSRYEDAVSNFRRSTELYERLHGLDYLITLRARRLLAAALRDGDELEKSLEILTRDLAVLERDRGSEDRDTRATAALLEQVRSLRDGAPASASKDSVLGG